MSQACRVLPQFLQLILWRMGAPNARHDDAAATVRLAWAILQKDQGNLQALSGPFEFILSMFWMCLVSLVQDALHA